MILNISHLRIFTSKKLKKCSSSKKTIQLITLLRVSVILSLEYILAMTKYCHLKQKLQSNLITPDEIESLKQIATENDFKIEDPPITAKQKIK
jgi:hypothetical protein